MGRDNVIYLHVLQPKGVKMKGDGAEFNRFREKKRDRAMVRPCPRKDRRRGDKGGVEDEAREEETIKSGCNKARAMSTIGPCVFSFRGLMSNNSNWEIKSSMSSLLGSRVMLAPFFSLLSSIVLKSHAKMTFKIFVSWGRPNKEFQHCNFS
jgi:hypothetical protein